MTSKWGGCVLEPLKFRVNGVDGLDPYHLVAKSRLHAAWFLACLLCESFVAPSPLLWTTLSMKIVLIHTFSQNSTLDTSWCPTSSSSGNCTHGFWETKEAGLDFE